MSDHGIFAFGSGCLRYSILCGVILGSASCWREFVLWPKLLLREKIGTLRAGPCPSSKAQKAPRSSRKPPGAVWCHAVRHGDGVSNEAQYQTPSVDRDF